ncbi:MAG: penicillin-insensitive murein endopeptidase [Methyloceanibacter sp.]|uniref:penicillin-insensitive murein endopeptidase n=1 Tax=Methyloceanibacter sp. TaxID=1965321 RepID=UPI003D6D9F90
MRGLFLSLILLLYCSGVSAEQIKAPKVGAKPVAAAATDKPQPKPAPKKPKAPPAPPAKTLFGAAATPAPLAARAIGSYSKGCLAGGVSLPINGPDWQVMRLTRNRNWGSPQLVEFMERLASDARALDGWPGLLVGDMSQPRGGPMLNGHTSHQIGLDADIWLTPMPDRILTPQEREDMNAVSMLKDPFSVDPEVFTLGHVKLIKRAASYPQLARIFVHPAIKKGLCERAASVGTERAWLGKVRPWWNHHYHFHVRLACPPGMAGCENQKPVLGDDGCGQELKDWYEMLKKSAIWQAEQQQAVQAAEEAEQDVKPDAKPAKPAKTKPPLRLTDLPGDCKTVLTAGGFEPPAKEEELPPVALKALASKDAGPGLPILTQAALQTLRNGGQIGMPMPDRNPIR